MAPTSKLRQTVALYQGLDSRCLIIHEPMYERHAEALLRLDPRLRLAVENHNLPPDGFARWAERFPGLTLDVEHLWKFTLRDAPLPALLGAVRDFLARYAGKLHHVHLPGYLPGYREHRPMYCAREMVFPVLEMLEEVAFEGLIVSEANPEYQNANELRMDVLLFDTWRDRQTASVLTGLAEDQTGGKAMAPGNDGKFERSPLGRQLHDDCQEIEDKPVKV